jgi:hypothetical protein
VRVCVRERERERERESSNFLTHKPKTGTHEEIENERLTCGRPKEMVR